LSGHRLSRAIDADGDFLDVGCANGVLAADVVEWAAARGFAVEPHGIDLGTRLIAFARRRHPTHAYNFREADAWTWEPERTWTFVFSTIHLAPAALAGEWIWRLSSWVKPGGRLILGGYGSKSGGIRPPDPEQALASCGLTVDGTSEGGDGPMSRFAWSTKELGAGLS
jgi:SAM-dependent methyltransferase